MTSCGVAPWGAQQRCECDGGGCDMSSCESVCVCYGGMCDQPKCNAGDVDINKGYCFCDDTCDSTGPETWKTMYPAGNEVERPKGNAEDGWTECGNDYRSCPTTVGGIGGCTEKCRCIGGYCTMSSCTEDCECPDGGCTMIKCEKNCVCPLNKCSGGATRNTDALGSLVIIPVALIAGYCYWKKHKAGKGGAAPVSTDEAKPSFPVAQS